MLSTITSPLFAVIQILAQDDTGSAVSYSSSGHVSPLVAVIDIALAVLFIASFWRIFSKAGQPGWAAIIPIYNWIVWCKVAGRPAWWFLLLLLCFPIFFIILCIDTAKAFGHGVGFALGLIFLGFIFFPVLAFGGSTYRGPVTAAGATPAV